MEIQLDPETEKFVNDAVQSGRYDDASHFIAAAVQYYTTAYEIVNEFTPEEVDEILARDQGRHRQAEHLQGEEVRRMLGVLREESQRLAG